MSALGRIAPQRLKPCPSQSLPESELFRSLRRGKPRLYTSFSAACEAVPFPKSFADELNQRLLKSFCEV